VTTSYLRVGIALTAASEAEFTSIAGAMDVPSSLKIAKPVTGQPPSSKGSSHPRVMLEDVESTLNGAN
jgi:hypothetical protein